MKIIHIILILFLSLLGNYSFSQITIFGNVSDNTTKEALPFVAVAIKSTTIGTVTDFEGNFKIRIPVEFQNSQLIVSCVGYVPAEFRISGIKSAEELSVKLSPQNNQLLEVVVSDKSLKPYTTVKNAIARIPENYLNKAFNYQLYFQNEDISEKRKRECIVELYDAKGYNKSDIAKTFTERNYQFVQARRNFPVKTISDASVDIDGILDFDIVRSPAFILDNARIYDFTLTFGKEQVYKADSVYVVEFSAKKSNLINSGEIFTTNYNGTLFIKKKNYAIIKSEIEMACSKINTASRSMYISEKQKDLLDKNVNFKITTEYEQKNNTYILKQIKLEKKIGKTTSEKTELIVLNCSQTPNPIKGRSYIEKLKIDKPFWDSFKLP